ncbi:hypothetical protein TVAG_580340 [Trichomonas vaginalis G3]|uniref:Uncharacterized protein n=1 Tax=Trichomonas vaginalis (strain ATCC PRA-98 / G3) TaxID=412133 RepID=A2GKB3_TRIV3|nr:hypothetical protein TVAGG3_0154250 [Trichomonas vaginalis G3]EAX82405.1 hypothetical protein TVAG_580340 [Trichomonas vaginalis G3]KAI5547462.1 hypothetical protein TVAGG3_0154250 [Trichomonas vaginalis G3]|eukprot:XP_001295335.1 hypothetical protein [Trichomonas vaginalis G3]
MGSLLLSSLEERAIVKVLHLEVVGQGGGGGRGLQNFTFLLTSSKKALRLTELGEPVGGLGYVPV